ncbi:MAG: hypothetical protein ABJA86_08995 [Nocardioidaceae bacterium]
MTSDTAPTVAGNEFMLIWNAMVANTHALVQQPKRAEDNDDDDSHPQSASFLEET